MKISAPVSRHIPLTVRVPALVAGLMIIVSAVVTQQVLSRLAYTQRSNLEALAGAYLDGLSTAVTVPVLRDDIWEVFDQLDRARDKYSGVRPVITVVTTIDDHVVAASEPKRFPTQAPFPPHLLTLMPKGNGVTVDNARERAFVSRLLDYQGKTIGRIYAELDIAHLLVERREVFITLASTNALLTLFLAGLGYLAIRGMVRPIEVLTERFGQGSAGTMIPIPLQLIGSPPGAFDRLYSKYNEMVRALNEREALSQRLAEEEKLASLGRLASGLAHEINNPLGGLLNTVDTLDRHGGDPDVRKNGIDLLKRGLKGMRDVVRSSLVTYKSQDDQSPLAPQDIDDLRHLIGHEVRRRSLNLDWRNTLHGPVGVSAGLVRQALLNLLLNACAASPVGGQLRLKVSHQNSDLTIEIDDQGSGIGPEFEAILEATAPPVAPHGTGLGLWVVRRLIDNLGGHAEVDSDDTGTRIRLRLPTTGIEEAKNVA